MHGEHITLFDASIESAITRVERIELEPVGELAVISLERWRDTHLPLATPAWRDGYLAWRTAWGCVRVAVPQGG